MHINWYPGHMTKARRQLEECVKQVDVVVQLLDARVPLASINPDLNQIARNKRRIFILNKADIADPAVTAQWIRYFQSQGCMACEMNARRNGKKAQELVKRAAADLIEKYKARGVNKTIRAMVVGIPNVGKSTLINSLSGGNKAKTGDKPGVTRGTQWIRLSAFLDLMDTPGLLWPKIENQTQARHLAFTGAINDDILDTEELMIALIDELNALYPQALANRYGIDPHLGGREALSAICRRRGWLVAGGEDYQRGARVILDEFRAGKLGLITLERVENTDDL